MKILVTGGAGFIGSHLILKLVSEGHDVICVDNLNEYYDPKLKRDRLEQFHDKIKFYQMDIADKDEFEKVFKENDIEKICHLAAQAGVRYSIENPFVYGDSNYIGTLNVLEFAKRYGVKHIVFASTSSIYGLNEEIPFNESDRVDTPISIYSASKRACELLAFSYCHLFGLNVTCLRFFTVYGPFGRPDMALFKFTKAVLEDRPIHVYNNGDMERDFTYVDDIVLGFYLALSKPSGFEIINLGCGNPVKLMDFISIIEKELGKEAKKNFLPMQLGDVKRTFANISKAKEVLGYEPKVMVAEGVKRFIEWYKGYYA
ncbi:SDR family NAD(P)-dependent oxidoreductase [Candidatus Woesearchaeota archaeon]|nr:SDR family NAD(P)-dependent oxidoreductase [Candidatus Woesearchaeota archaeon]